MKNFRWEQTMKRQSEKCRRNIKTRIERSERGENRKMEIWQKLMKVKKVNICENWKRENENEGKENWEGKSKSYDEAGGSFLGTKKRKRSRKEREK